MRAIDIQSIGFPLDKWSYELICGNPSEYERQEGMARIAGSLLKMTGILSEFFLFFLLSRHVSTVFTFSSPRVMRLEDEGERVLRRKGADSRIISVSGASCWPSSSSTLIRKPAKICSQPPSWASYLALPAPSFAKDGSFS